MDDPTPVLSPLRNQNIYVDIIRTIDTRKTVANLHRYTFDLLAWVDILGQQPEVQVLQIFSSLLSSKCSLGSRTYWCMRKAYVFCNDINVDPAHVVSAY